MTIFGRTIDAQQIASLVFMLAVLVLWIGAFRGERGWARWFRRWEGDRKSRREAELSAEGKGNHPPSSSDGPRGPWG